MDFTGKTVAVTGAGKGIGRETARLMAARGAAVVAISRSKDDLQALAAEIDCRTIAVDLADAAAARVAARDAMPADLLVNCAGINVLQPFLEVTDDAFDLIHAVNTRAAMIVAQEFARHRV
ncbi:MAG TPA: SDR family NAD(P)-dependent oxidoreductase, partial [Methylomirabilota bacterium]|nr:SDR family NAD(P)-dependent oxidoreductase [Methylomirabilota bacterium]